MILSSKEKKEKLKEVDENSEKLDGSKKVIMMQLMSWVIGDKEFTILFYISGGCFADMRCWSIRGTILFSFISALWQLANFQIVTSRIERCLRKDPALTFGHIDRFFLCLAPFLFLIFNVIYWIYFLFWDCLFRQENEHI